MSDVDPELAELDRRRVQGYITQEEYLRALRGTNKGAFRRGIGAGVVGGCFGLIALLIALVVGGYVALVLALRGGGDANTFGDDPDVHVALTAGNRAAIPSWDQSENGVTLLSVTDPIPEASSSSPTRAGFRLVEVVARVESTRDHPSYGEGGDFASSFQLGTILPNTGDQTIPSGNVNGLKEARSIEVKLTFEVPDGASIDWLRYNPNSFAGSIYFESE